MAGDGKLDAVVNLPERFIRDLEQRVFTRPEVQRVILFGSRACGDAGERSDIDLAIEAPEATRPQWTDLSLFLREDAATLLEVDVVRLEQASERLRERILREGQVLYERTTG